MTQLRIAKIQALLKENQLDAFLVEDPLNLFYFTQSKVSAGQLIITPTELFFYVDQRYYQKCYRSHPSFVYPIEKAPLSQRLKPFAKIGFDSETFTFARMDELQAYSQFISFRNIFKQIRMIKDDSEIALLKQAAALGCEGFDYVLTLLSEGISEQEVALELEIFWKKKGSQGVAFEPIIAFSENSSMPHHRAGTTRLKKGHPILIDIGVLYQNYHSDMTRVVFLDAIEDEMLTVYEVVKRAQEESLKLCKPGTLIKDLDRQARLIIEEAGYGDCFTHSLGHGVGLEIHEFPPINQKSALAEIPLEKGMVITIEPGIYLPGVGGVRLEDTVAITETGHDNLTLRPLSPLLLSS